MAEQRLQRIIDAADPTTATTSRSADFRDRFA